MVAATFTTINVTNTEFLTETRNNTVIYYNNYNAADNPGEDYCQLLTPLEVVTLERCTHN